MTVGQLITALQEYEPGLSVMVDGYEYGVSTLDPKHVYLSKVAVDVHKGQSYCGEHDELHADDDPTDEWSPYNEATIVDAVMIARGPKW